MLEREAGAESVEFLSALYCGGETGSTVCRKPARVPRGKTQLRSAIQTPTTMRLRRRRSLPKQHA